MNKQFPFDTSFQLSVLKLMTEDEAFLMRAAKYLKDSYFENQYLGYFFNLTLRYYNQYASKPDEVYFLNEIKKFAPDQQRAYITYYVKIKGASVVSRQYVIENLVGFIRRNMFIDMYNEMANLYEESAENAFQYTAEQIETLRAVSFTEDLYLSFKDLDDVIEQVKEESVDALQIGLSKIDKALNGGIYKGDLCVFLGDTNAGKSVILLNLLYHSIRQSRKVLFLNLEGRKGQPLLRLASRATGIPYNRILTKNFVNEEEKESYASAIAAFSDPEMFQIRNLHDTQGLSQSLMITVEDVYALCCEVRKSFPFDVLIIDYGDRLDTRKKCSNRTEAQRIVYEGLDNMAKIFNVPVITASQVTRPENAARAEGWLRMRDVAEAYAKVKVAAVVLSINRSEQEKTEGRLRILLDKSRDGETNIKVGCYSDYSTLTPYDEEDLGCYDVDSMMTMDACNES